MKKSFSLRTRILAITALLILLQSLGALFAHSVSGVYLKLDGEAFRLFESSGTAVARSYNDSAKALVANLAVEAQALSTALNELAAEAGVGAEEIYLGNELYLAAASAGAEALLRILSDNTASGAFMILNGSNADKGSSGRHSVVFIRDSAPLRGGSVDTGRYQLKYGPISISESFGIPTDVGWDLDTRLSGSDAGVYKMPIEAALTEPDAGLERCAYWSPPVDVFSDGREAVLLSMPLISAEGTPYGVVGLDISLSVLNQHYLSSSALPYSDGFVFISPVSEGEVTLDWFIPSGPIAQVYLGGLSSLQLSEVKGSSLFEAELPGLGAMYAAVYPISMYSGNSMFYDDSWTLVSMVTQASLHDTSASVRLTLIVSTLVTAAVSLVVMSLLVYTMTRRISGLSEYVKRLSPYMNIRFEKTSIKEIDDLSAAVESFSRSVVQSSKTTSKVLELTLLPIGEYEVSDEMETVILTDFVYDFLPVGPGSPVSKEAWVALRGKLMSDPAPGHENIYRARHKDGDMRYLRIHEGETEKSTVGVMMDVTKDIEEHRRLADELDYDALTRLYNRTAFKREAHKLIRGEPDKIGVMIFIDLDNLKHVNDTFGHDTGDKLIIRAADTFSAFRKLGGVVARISGDEFAIYLHGYDTKEEARKAVYMQYESNRREWFRTPDGELQKIRASSGLAFYPEDSDNETDLLKLADFAMYEAKHTRKGSVHEFSLESYREKGFLVDSDEAMTRLLDDRLIRFAFQPIVDLKSGKVFAYEALMRPVLGDFASATEILSAAAEQSKLAQLEMLVLTTALQYVKDNENKLGGAKVFINSIKGQPMTAEEGAELKSRYSDVFDKVAIELPEGSDVERDSEARFRFMRDNGTLLVIDDVGSDGGPPRAELTDAADLVKLDIGLISGIDEDPKKQRLVSELVDFCAARSIKLVAEGVETERELQTVIRLGVDYAQGYYLARPQFDPPRPSEEAVDHALRYQYFDK